MLKRNGITLVESLVVIGIIAILLGIMVPAVMRVRELGLRTQSLNNMRQIVLATHHFASANRDRLPSLEGNSRSPNPGFSLFAAILPYIEQDAIKDQMGGDSRSYTPVRTFLSPSDPTVSDAIANHASVSSYAANAQVFLGNPNLASSIPDGVSNTIAFGEHYSFKCDNTIFMWILGQTDNVGLHRASFADAHDFTSANGGNPFTFQAAPRVEDCRRMVPQTPHSAGMVTALVDGSVRILSPRIASNTFWHAVSPNGGEPVGGDWDW